MSKRKEAALAALLTSRTRSEAAEKAGIDERTLRRFFKEDEFRRRYRQATDAIIEDASRQAKSLINPALETLQTVMDDEERSAYARVRAAEVVLDFAVRLHEQADLTSRIEELEQLRYEEES